jgi:hypothetical protein
MSELEVRAHLGNFGLSGDIALKPIGSLSGGQKARYGNPFPKIECLGSTFWNLD